MVKDSLTLVPCEEKYWEFIRELRNDVEIQKGFVEKVNISKEDQVKYMSKYNINYFVCLLGDRPVGYIGEIGGDIRLATDKGFQGLGIGKFMVKELISLRPNAYAKVKHDNIPSKRVFIGCNFEFWKIDDNFVYYKPPQE